MKSALHFPCLFLAFTLASAAALGTAVAGDVAASPEQIAPIAVGDAIPSVDVRTVDGESVDLRALVSRQPTVLIFYRGGW